MSAGRLPTGSTLCTAQSNAGAGRPQLKPIMMARNASLGENMPPNGGGETSRQSHLAPPPVTPDSPRPQKGDPSQSPLAAVSSLTVPLPASQAGKSQGS